MPCIGVVVLTIVAFAIAASPVGGADLILTLGLLGFILLLGALTVSLVRLAVRLLVGAPRPKRPALRDERATSGSQRERATANKSSVPTPQRTAPASGQAQTPPFRD